MSGPLRSLLIVEAAAVAAVAVAAVAAAVLGTGVGPVIKAREASTGGDVDEEKLGAIPAGATDVA